MPDLFITCPSGMENLLKQEMHDLGISQVRLGKSGVYLPQSMDFVYRVNYCSRIATRVLWPIASFPCADKNDLYRSSKQIDWSRYLSLKTTFSIDPNVDHPNLRNSLFAAMVVKDAICDLFREKTKARPNIQVSDPDVQLNLFIHNGRATISLDTSGAPLFKRGYRKQTTLAPLQESLAAAILTLCDYSSNEILCDPFCGSGTFLIEAAMIATRTPAGFFRKSWGFSHLPHYSESAWLACKNTANERVIPLEKEKIFGSDIDQEALRICQGNLQQSGFDPLISLERKDIRSYFPEFSPTCIICNPPYGKRLQSSEEIYRALGKFLKSKCAPTTRAYILIPEEQVKEVDLPCRKILSFSNGGLDVSLMSIM